MFRQREKFDRIDVPRDSPHRNLIGAIVCVAVLAAVAVTVAVIWNRVQLESRLGDTGLAGALGKQAAEVVPDGGYAASTDEFSCVLLLEASSLDATGASLSSARILALNETQGTAALVQVPLDAKVVSGDEPTTLAELYAGSGYAACVAPLSSAANVAFDHVVVATGDVIGEAASLAGSGVSEIVRSASDLLSKMRTDMDAQDLLSLAESLAGVGTENLTAADAALVPETTQDEEGNVSETGYQVIDKAQLGLALGLLVAA